VPVGANAEQDQIDDRRLQGHGAGSAAQLAQAHLVRNGGFGGVVFAAHAKDILRRYRDTSDERLSGHSVVALRGIRWHAALVAPEKVNLTPRYGRQPRVTTEELVEAARRGAAAERCGERAASLDGVTRGARKDLGAAPCHRRVVGQHLDGATARPRHFDFPGDHGRLQFLPSAAISSKPASGPQVPAT
jgi:hypothetical protein